MRGEVGERGDKRFGVLKVVRDKRKRERRSAVIKGGGGEMVWEWVK